MSVRDFFNRAIARLTGRAGDSRSSQHQQAALHSVATQVASAERQANIAPRHALGNWLEDGRRLRVRLASAFTAPQEEQRRTDARTQGAERQRVISSPNRRSAETPDALPQTAPLIPPGTALEPASPTSFSDASLEEIEAMDEGQRKLIFLSYLVRQGIYNEGFKGADVPEQYRRSQGRDQEPDTPDQDAPAQ
jgi:hypothetical protein